MFPHSPPLNLVPDLRTVLRVSSGIDPVHTHTEVCRPRSFSVLSDLFSVPTRDHVPSTMGYGPRLHSYEGTDATTHPRVQFPLAVVFAVDSALGLVGAVKRLHSSEKLTNSSLGWGVTSYGIQCKYVYCEALLRLTLNVTSQIRHIHIAITCLRIL